MVDFWPKRPQYLESCCDDGNYDDLGMLEHLSLGEVRRLPNSDMAVSSPRGTWEYVFSWRAYMDDPYIRIIMRGDVPIVELNAVWEKALEFLSLARARSLDAE